MMRVVNERAAASESRERSGARGPRERACRGVRRGEAPRIKEDMADHLFDGHTTEVGEALEDLLKDFNG